jgi:hypothetical protein
MASNWTNRGRYKALEHVFRGAALPTNFFVALITNAAVPTVDTNTLGELTQIASGNGYTTNGISLTKNATDFDVLTEDDTNDRALIQIKDLVWTASGGTLPASGSGAYYAVLTDDNATPANRLVYAFHDLVGPISVSSGQPLTVQDIELRLA